MNLQLMESHSIPMRSMRRGARSARLR